MTYTPTASGPRTKLSRIAITGLVAAVATAALRLLYFRFFWDAAHLESASQRIGFFLQSGLAFFQLHIGAFDLITRRDYLNFVGPLHGDPLHSSVYRNVAIGALPWLVVPWAWSRLPRWRRARSQDTPGAPNSSAPPKHR